VIRDGSPENYAGEMLRTKIFDRLGRGTRKVRRTGNEFVLRRYEYVKGFSVTHHIEEVGAYDRRLSDHTNAGRPFGQQEATDFMVLLDHSGIGGAGREDHRDGSIQRRHGLGLVIEACDEFLLGSNLSRRGRAGGLLYDRMARGTPPRQKQDQNCENGEKKTVEFSFGSRQRHELENLAVES